MLHWRNLPNIHEQRIEQLLNRCDEIPRQGRVEEFLIFTVFHEIDSENRLDCMDRYLRIWIFWIDNNAIFEMIYNMVGSDNLYRFRYETC